jgi:hypothetical protein
MRLFLDKNNMIIGYELTGASIDGIEYDSALPDDFYLNFKSSFYMLKEGLIVENPDYVEPVPNIPAGPTNLQQIVMQQSMIIAQMQQTLMQQNQDIAKLKGANA